MILVTTGLKSVLFLKLSRVTDTPGGSWYLTITALITHISSCDYALKIRSFCSIYHHIHPTFCSHRSQHFRLNESTVSKSCTQDCQTRRSVTHYQSPVYSNLLWNTFLLHVTAKYRERIAKIAYLLSRSPITSQYPFYEGTDYKEAASGYPNH